MDKIGEANKPMEARVADMIQDERKRKDEKQKDVVVYKPRDVGAIDTSAFIKSDMNYGLDRVFRLADALLPGELVPPFACPGLLGDTVELFTSGSPASPPSSSFTPRTSGLRARRIWTSWPT